MLCTVLVKVINRYNKILSNCSGAVAMVGIVAIKIKSSKYFIINESNSVWIPVVSATNNIQTNNKLHGTSQLYTVASTQSS